MPSRLSRRAAHLIVLSAAIVYLPMLDATAQAQDSADCFPPCREGFVCQAGACVTPTTTATCFPSCREGFVCRDAQCVTGCDPACASTERCDAGRCVADTPAPTTAPVDGKPLWGQGAASDGSPTGTQTWTPTLAPPQPLSPEEEARRAWRTRIRLPLYLEVGGGYERGSDSFVVPNGTTFDVRGGLGMRYHFLRWMGVQLRAMGAVGTLGNDSGMGEQLPSYYEADRWQSRGVGFAAEAELGLRLGPVADVFPWYLGGFAGVGLRFARGDATCIEAGNTYTEPLACDPERSDPLNSTTSVGRKRLIDDRLDAGLGGVLGYVADLEEGRGGSTGDQWGMWVHAGQSLRIPFASESRRWGALPSETLGIELGAGGYALLTDPAELGAFGRLVFLAYWFELGLNTTYGSATGLGVQITGGPRFGL